MKRATVSPGSIQFILILASLLVVLGAPARAQVPTESDVYVDRGVLAYDGRQYSQALEAFQEALRLTPDNVNALYYTGLTYMAMDQPAAAVEPLERARQLAPNDLDVAFQLGVAYFTQQRYDRAEPLMREVIAREPKRQNVGYYVGFMEYRKQNYREALRHLRANVPSDENFAQLSPFYAALSLSAMGLAGQARSEIEEAIRAQPVSPLTGPAERFRDVLGTAAKAERKFHIDTKLSFFYDDNVPVNPTTGIDPAVALARQAKHRSTGELGFVRFEYTPLKTPDWEAAFGYSLLQTINNEVAHYNVQNHTGSGSLTYKASLKDMPFVASLAYQYDYMSLDDRNFISRHTVAPGASLVWSGMHLSQVQFRYQNKDFMHEKTLVSRADARDASNYMVGLAHYLRFSGDQHYVKFGYQFDYEAADGNNWDYNGHRAVAGAQVTLPLDLKLRYDFDMHFRDYRHLHTYLPTGIAQPAIHRSDRDMNHMVSLSKDLPYNLTVAVEYLYSRAFSNLEVYDYTRNVVSLSVSWRY